MHLLEASNDLEEKTKLKKESKAKAKKKRRGKGKEKEAKATPVEPNSSNSESESDSDFEEDSGILQTLMNKALEFMGVRKGEAISSNPRDRGRRRGGDFDVKTQASNLSSRFDAIAAHHVETYSHQGLGGVSITSKGSACVGGSLGSDGAINIKTDGDLHVPQGTTIDNSNPDAAVDPATVPQVSFVARGDVSIGSHSSISSSDSINVDGRNVSADLTAKVVKNLFVHASESASVRLGAVAASRLSVEAKNASLSVGAAAVSSVNVLGEVSTKVHFDQSTNVESFTAMSDGSITIEVPQINATEANIGGKGISSNQINNWLQGRGVAAQNMRLQTDQHVTVKEAVNKAGNLVLIAPSVDVDAPIRALRVTIHANRGALRVNADINGSLGTHFFVSPSPLSYSPVLHST